MTKTEIKKLVYRQKPDAILQFIRMGVAYYSANILVHNGTSSEVVHIRFQVPVDDMGTTDFTPKEEAKLMLRWLDWD